VPPFAPPESSVTSFCATVERPSGARSPALASTNLAGSSNGGAAVSRGIAFGPSTSADSPAPTSISPAALRTAMRPSATATRRPRLVPGAHIGSHTVSTAE